MISSNLKEQQQQAVESSQLSIVDNITGITTSSATNQV